MFEVKGHKILIKDLHKIVGNYTVIINDGENDVIYYGTNKYGNKILGVIIFEDNDDEYLRYSHTLLSDQQLNEFLNKDITYLSLLKEVQSFFIVDRNYHGEELSINLISFDELPDNFKPLENSFCPDFITNSSFNYAVSMKGDLSDIHLVLPNELNNVNSSFYSFLKTSTDFMKDLDLDPSVYVEALQTGSFRINFKILFKEPKQFRLYPISIEKVNTYFNNFLKYVFNTLPNEELTVFKTETVESAEFKKLENSLSELYLTKSKKRTEESIEQELIDSISYSVNNLKQLHYSENFNRIEIINYSENASETSLGLIDENYIPLVENKLYRFSRDKQEDRIAIDEIPKEYEFQVFHLNAESGNGKPYYEENNSINRISFHAKGRSDYRNSILTKSMDDSAKIKITGIGKRVNNVVKEITLDL